MFVCTCGCWDYSEWYLQESFVQQQRAAQVPCCCAPDRTRASGVCKIADLISIYSCLPSLQPLVCCWLAALTCRHGRGGCRQQQQQRVTNRPHLCWSKLQVVCTGSGGMCDCCL
jgi:hypothetical protein